MFHFHGFSNLSTTKNHYIASPEFTCNGHHWGIRVLPGRSSRALEGNVSFYLNHLSREAIITSFDIKVVDKFGRTKVVFTKIKTTFNGRQAGGVPNLISRSVILDESNNILDSNGTLTVVVSIEEGPTTVFVPNNPHTTVFIPQNPLVKMMQAMFNDENSADVCFDVSDSEGKKDDGGNKRVKTTTSFYAHRLILENCAPMLAAICGSNEGGGKVTTASVNDIKPHIFSHLLSYVYGGSVPEEVLKTHAKDIIDAADKYSIVNLKLAAEAAFVESTDISLDNAMDNLLYADSRNCALLKEAVMNFLAENHREAAVRISFTDCPGHLMKDLLVAFSGKYIKADANRTEKDDLTTLSVSALRRKLHKMGLEVDGSREAMIEEIKRKSHS